MATLLWLAIGVLVALLSRFLPEVTLVGLLVVVALMLVAFLLPRKVTSIGAKVAIGFGATFVVLSAQNLFRDPLGATGASYLLFGGGLLIMVGGVVGAWRYRRWRQKALEVAAGQL
ncbi:MAG: hypothetical protein ACRDFZ_01300 [Candidatus Limnocylindria bacterium]